MNPQAVFHQSSPQFCAPFREADGSCSLRLRLRVGKNDLTAADCIYGCKFTWHEERFSVPMEKAHSTELFDYYTITLRPADTRVAYLFCLHTDTGSYYFSELGLTEQYIFEEGYFHFFQFPEFNESDIPMIPSFTADTVACQIFVERFAIGCTDKDMSYINLQWGEKPKPDSFAGGDLCGIQKHLDYLAETGFTLLYLTPVFPSVSNHKYDILDYFDVDRAFGGKEALRALIDAAHARGIRVLLDAVFNHCSSLHPFFQDVIQHGAASRYYDWFFIDGDTVNLTRPNYRCFASVPYMPKLNTNHPEVVSYLCEVGSYWIREFHIDGWRLDVADEVSHTFWRAFRQRVKAENPNTLLIGELWHDALPWVAGDQFDSAMNYAFTKACTDYLCNGRLNAEQFAWRLTEVLLRCPDYANAMMLNLLDSHDTDRFFYLLHGDVRRFRLALALLFCYTGIPCLFSGDEIGIQGGYDPDCRRTFLWDRALWNHTVYETVRTLAALRHDSPALQIGEISCCAQNGLFCLRRSCTAETVTLYCNATAQKRRVPSGPLVPAYDYAICRTTADS